jgi:hypothetical protein
MMGRKTTLQQLRALAFGAAAAAMVAAVFLMALHKDQPNLPATTTGTASGPKAAEIDLVTASEKLRTAGSPSGAQDQLMAIRQSLRELSPSAAAAAIRQFLDSKADSPTHLPFKIGTNGFLVDAPSLRTFLLDYLGQTDPAAAADYARTILSSPDSADEWAISLRDYALAKTSTDDRAFLRQKFIEMIHNQAWSNAPPVGFLEAFDVAVYAGGTDLLPDLSALLRQKDNQAVAHAAFLALDRLVQSEPAAVLGELQAHPDYLSGRENTRADFFARADVTDPQQRTILENYLLAPSLSDAELQKFAATFPNANYMVSQNLLTHNPIPSRTDRDSRDRETLGIVQTWISDPRFQRLIPSLQTITTRLQSFLGKASP